MAAAAQAVALITPEGDVQEFAPDSAANLLSFGNYKPATPENLHALQLLKAQEGVLPGARAAIEAGARGLTGGLSDVAEAKLGLATPEELQARTEAHPYVSAAGKFLGQAAGLAGATAAATAALPATLGVGATALIGGMLGGVAGGAAQAGAEELSRQVLGPAPLVGEQVAQHALQGAITGALGGVLGWAGGQVLGKALRGAAGLSDFAERQALRATGATATQLGKLEESGLASDVGRHILDEGYLGQGIAGNTAGEARAAAKGVAEEAGNTIGDTLSSMGAVPRGLRRTLAADLRTLAAPGPWEEAFPAAFKGRLEEAAKLLEGRPSVSVDDLQALKQEIGDAVRTQGGRQAPPALKDAYRAVNDAIDNLVPSENAEGFLAAKEQYGLAKEAAKLFKGAANREFANPAAGGLADPMALGAAVLHPGAAAAYLAGKYALRAGRLGNVARAADWLSSTALVQRMANNANAQWLKAVDDVLAGNIGTAAHALVTPERYNEVARLVDRAQQDPQGFVGAVQQALGPELADKHPDIATHASLVVQNVFAHAAQTMPKAPFAPTPLDSSYTPSTDAKTRWLDMIRAIADPASVISNPTPEALQTLQTVYPDSYQAMVQHIQNKLSGASANTLPYRSKVIVSQFLGAPISTYADVALGQRLQQLYAQQAAQQQQGGNGGDQRGSARTQSAKVMRFKQIAQDESTMVDRMRQPGDT